jgi:ABC-type multidrug transport system fused ATPase/permease subunit
LTLKNINLKILKNSKVGIIGATGSGKTTTVDILLGLLQPQNGALEVDGQIITSKNARAWQTLVGYVPQYIYLSDDSVAANIAFGVDKKDVDQSKLENVAKVASIHEFVLNELPSKYQTEIGERGIRLSGGQRQRIGIARALYHKPKVLVLDEATSALDNNTEELVMSALSEFCKNDVTIITIAHRLSTLKKCDKIFLLDKGKVTISGTYEEIIEKN